MLRLNSGDGSIDLDVTGFEAWLLAVQIETKPYPGAEDQAVRGSAEVEHAKLIAFVDMLVNGDRDVARRNLRHFHRHEAHQPYPRIVRLNQDDGAGGHFRDIGLGIIGRCRIEPLSGSLRVVAAVDDVGLRNGSVDRTVPSVVTERAEKSLVDRATLEQRSDRVVREHVSKRIGLPLDPESVIPLDIMGDPVGSRFAGIDNDGVVPRRGHGALPATKLTREEVVPRRESVVGLTRTAHELIHEARHGRQGIPAEPSAAWIRVQDVAGIR